MTDYAASALDGQWHEVVIPLADLYGGDGKSEFDPKTATFKRDRARPIEAGAAPSRGRSPVVSRAR